MVRGFLRAKGGKWVKKRDVWYNFCFLKLHFVLFVFSSKMFIQSRIKIQESPLKKLFWESSGQKMFLSPQPNLYIELLGNNVIPSISFSPACASDFVQNFNNICSGLFIKIYLVVSRIGICIGEASA